MASKKVKMSGYTPGEAVTWKGEVAKIVGPDPRSKGRYLVQFDGDAARGIGPQSVDPSRFGTKASPRKSQQLSIKQQVKMNLEAGMGDVVPIERVESAGAAKSTRRMKTSGSGPANWGPGGGGIKRVPKGRPDGGQFTE